MAHRLEGKLMFLLVNFRDICRRDYFMFGLEKKGTTIQYSVL